MVHGDDNKTGIKSEALQGAIEKHIPNRVPIDG